MHCVSNLSAMILGILGTVLVLACGPAHQVPGTLPAGCQFLDGKFSAPLDAATCTADPGLCATHINSCLKDFDYVGSDALWVLRNPDGVVPVASTGAKTVRALAREQSLTPMHGRFNTVFMNETAAKAFNQQILRDPLGHLDRASLPYGSVVIKKNFSTSSPPPQQFEELEGEPWLTVMAKIEGYCNPTIGGSCIGGEWFYYLFRFGNFMQFNEIPVYGKAQAFCTDCHNPVAKGDFLWNLHLYLRARQTPYIEDGTTAAAVAENTKAVPPRALCADGLLGIGPDAPADVPFAPGDIPEPDRQPMFDCFSWRTFAAFNWPVAKGERGVPAADSSIADLGPSRVWESYKETAEVFQPEDPSWTIDDQAWDDHQFIPEICQEHLASFPEPERAKVLQMITKTRSQQVLNETHQAIGNQFNILVDQSGKLLRYEVRFNRDEFEYLKANGFANTGNYSFEGPKNADVFFPTNANGLTGLGATEIKASWRELCSPDGKGACSAEEEVVADRYYTQLSLIYTPKTRQSEESCRFSKTGLVGLHIIRKTVHAPQWVWSTFEHVDNVPPVGAQGDPETDYLLYGQDCQDRLPSDEICSLQRPGAIPSPTAPNRGCCQNAQLIVNANPGKLRPDGTLQPEDDKALIKNQITRLVQVGPTAMNSRFQAALPAPWNNYFLLNTQWPSGARQIAGQPQASAARRIPCNVRDELWPADGSPSAFVKAGIPKPECYTMQPRSGSEELKLRNTTMETFQAAWNAPGSDDAQQVSSQSCFGCHGFSGVDFSFAWTDATEEVIPFPPPPPPTAGT